MRPALKRAAVLITGWAFILLGIVGLFLPILQGILFLLIGLIILSTEYVWAHHLLLRLRKYPKVDRVVAAATDKAKSWMARISGRRPQSE